MPDGAVRLHADAGNLHGGPHTLAGLRAGHQDELRVGRRDERAVVIIALGKGGVGEVARFAAVFCRCGVNHVQAPTTTP